MNPSHTVLQIESEEDWFRHNGLFSPSYGAESQTNQLEARQRFEEQKQYQAQVHEQIFRDKDKMVDEARSNRMEEWKGDKILIVTERSTSKDESTNTLLLDLVSVARHSDMIYTLADSREYFEANQTKTDTLKLSLEPYSNHAVKTFFGMLLDESRDDNVYRRDDGECLVNCCRLAHYLQCNAFLENIIDILVESVNSENCLSLLALADELTLPRLLESSLSYILEALPDKSMDSQEEKDMWHELHPELRDQVESMRTLLQTKNTCKLFFNSLPEYLALFSEQVQYYKERLHEARLQQAERNPSSPAWQYAQEKIDLQSRRVNTLVLMLEKQKRIFSRGHL